MKHVITAVSLAFASITPWAHAQLRAPEAVQGEFEVPPLLRASEILRPEYVRGLRFHLQEDVPTYAGQNQYVIESDAGTFIAEGNAQLMQRLREVGAILRLQETSRTEEYKSALRKAAASPVQMAGNLAREPVKTISGVPKGMWKMLNRAGQTIKEARDERPRNRYEDSNLESAIGFSKVKRELAMDLGVDPYSSNEVLQKELNGISWAAFGGNMTLRAALAPVGGGAGAALSAAQLAGSVSQSLVDMSPGDLRRANVARLLKMDVKRAEADAFLKNPAFSPMHQTIIVACLERLRGAAWRSEFIYLSGKAEDETDALFFQRCAQLIATLQLGQPIARVGALRGFPIVLMADGTLVVPLEWDYAAWTKNAADFANTVQTIPWGKHPITKRKIVITGIASPKARAGFAAHGIELVEKALPGPLL